MIGYVPDIIAYEDIIKIVFFNHGEHGEHGIIL